MSPQLSKRQLGRDGPLVTALGFGGMGLSVFYGKVDSDEERFKILDRAYELGETFWDSADMYGDNEDLIGKWFQRTGKRDDVRWTYICACEIALNADIQVDLPCHQVCQHRGTGWHPSDQERAGVCEGSVCKESETPWGSYHRSLLLSSA